ncbi:uncharacterized protein METZ01_LOCUS75492, partial [marine metagenome]
MVHYIPTKEFIMRKLNNSATLTIIAASFILFISTTVLSQARYP